MEERPGLIAPERLPSGASRDEHEYSSPGEWKILKLP